MEKNFLGVSVSLKLQEMAERNQATHYNRKHVRKSLGKSLLFILFFFLLIIIAKPGFPKKHSALFRAIKKDSIKSTSEGTNKIRIVDFYRKIDLTNNYFNAMRQTGLSKFLVNNEKCQIPDFEVQSIPGRRITEMENREITECEEKHFNLTYSKDDLILFNKQLLMEMGYDKSSISCCYNAILRQNNHNSTFIPLADRKVKFSRCIPMSTEGGTRPRYSFIKVKCEATGSLEGLKEVIYENFHALPILSARNLKKKVQFWGMCTNSSGKQNASESSGSDNSTRPLKMLCNTNSRPPNILLIGLDSTSRMNSQRLMHRTAQVLNDTLKAIEMKGYNKVGSNTFPNIVPLLTSYSEQELKPICYPDRWTPQDNCPYIWKGFSKSNYLTAHLEDAPKYAIFNFWKSGFWNSPSDFYLRPFMLALYNDLKENKRPRCVYKSPEKIILDFIADLVNASMIKGIPYFITSWFTDLTHQDTKKLGVMDNLLADTLLTLHGKGLLENTILLVMSDHGYRYKSVRRTLLGWYEDKLPMFWLHIPPTLRKSHQHWMEALIHNSGQLVTPFDVHEALRDILLLTVPKTEAMKLNHNRKSHGISLFTKHPHRSCEEASIPQQYCACAVPTTYDGNQTLIMDGAEAIVSHINNMVPPSCRQLKVHKVTSTGMFSQSQLAAGNSMKSFGNSSVIHQLIIGLITTPGNFHFEAWITFDNSTFAILEVSHISRVSEMSNRDISNLSACLNETNVDMMEFCFCKPENGLRLSRNNLTSKGWSKVSVE